MWWTALLLSTGAQGAGTALPPPLPRPTRAPEAVVVDRYGDFLDAGLTRRLRGRALRRADLGAEEDAALLGAAAGDAMIDWTGWVVSSLPGAGATAGALLDGPAVTLSAGRDGPHVDADRAEVRAADRDRTLAAADRVGHDGAAPQLRVGLAPRLSGFGGDASGPDAIVDLTGRSMLVDEWRIAARALQHKLSAFARQGLTREVSLVAAAETLPEARQLAEVTGGALLRLGDGLRAYGHYTRSFARKQRPAEDLVGVTFSVVPERNRKDRDRGRGGGGLPPS